MAPTFTHGKGAFFSVTSATGGTINFSSGLDDCTLSRQLDTAEVTTFGDNDRNYIVGLRGADFSISGHFSSTHTKKLDPLLGHSTIPQFVYGPQGTSSGSRKYTGGCIMTSLEYHSPVDDKVDMGIDFIVTGAITSTSY